MDTPREIRFTIPGNPKAKDRARHRVIKKKDGTQFVTTYTPKKTEIEEAVIRYHAGKAMEGKPLMSGPLELFLCIYRRIPQSWSTRKKAQAAHGMLFPISKPDYDNNAKLQDALNNVVWNDDAQIVDAHIYKRFSDKPRLAVIVKEKFPPLLSTES